MLFDVFLLILFLLNLILDSGIHKAECFSFAGSGFADSNNTEK